MATLSAFPRWRTGKGSRMARGQATEVWNSSSNASSFSPQPRPVLPTTERWWVPGHTPGLDARTRAEGMKKGPLDSLLRGLRRSTVLQSRSNPLLSDSSPAQHNLASSLGTDTTRNFNTKAQAQQSKLVLWGSSAPQPGPKQTQTDTASLTDKNTSRNPKSPKLFQGGLKKKNSQLNWLIFY